MIAPWSLIEESQERVEPLPRYGLDPCEEGRLRSK
jgi:hypothetical protein